MTEVIVIETKTFDDLVDRIIEQVKLRLADKPQQWISPEQAMKKLHIKSKTTMQQLRDTGKIRFTQPAKRWIVYDSFSIDAFFERHVKEPF